MHFGVAQRLRDVQKRIDAGLVEDELLVVDRIKRARARRLA